MCVFTVIGQNIPPEFIPSCEKGARAACAKGVLAGYPLSGVRVVLTDGASHVVDSSDNAFQLAMQYAMRDCVKNARPQILEPVMNVEVMSPTEFQGTIVGNVNKRNGCIVNTDLSDDGGLVTIKAEVPLVQMFGYSTDLRSSTQGKGEFTMEYLNHAAVSREAQEKLIQDFAKKIAEEEKEK
jgi:elongation factor G